MRRSIGIGQSPHHAHAEADGEAVLVVGRLQRAVPAGGVDADRPDLDAMVAGIADDLRRRIETHRLRVEQRRAEDIRDASISSRTRHRRSARSEAAWLSGKP